MPCLVLRNHGKWDGWGDHRSIIMYVEHADKLKHDDIPKLRSVFFLCVFSCGVGRSLLSHTYILSLAVRIFLLDIHNTRDLRRTSIPSILKFSIICGFLLWFGQVPPSKNNQKRCDLPSRENVATTHAH